VGLDELWFFFDGLTISSVDLSLDLLEFTGDVSGMAINNWGVSVMDFTWVTEDDDLSIEG